MGRAGLGIYSVSRICGGRLWDVSIKDFGISKIQGLKIQAFAAGRGSGLGAQVLKAPSVWEFLVSVGSWETCIFVRPWSNLIRGLIRTLVRKFYPPAILEPEKTNCESSIEVPFLRANRKRLGLLGLNNKVPFETRSRAG